MKTLALSVGILGNGCGSASVLLAPSFGWVVVGEALLAWILLVRARRSCFASS